MRHKPIKAAARVKHPDGEPPPARPRVLRLIKGYYVNLGRCKSLISCRKNKLFLPPPTRMKWDCKQAVCSTVSRGGWTLCNAW